MYLKGEKNLNRKDFVKNWNEEEILLTNEWTNSISGHAREELKVCKKLLSANSVKSITLSTSADFGDVYMKPAYSRLWRMLPSRSPFFQKKIEEELHSLGAAIAEATRRRPNVKSLIFTSQHAKSTPFLIEKLSKTDVRVRLISIPASKLQKRRFQSIMSRNDEVRRNISVETNAQSRWMAKEYRIDAGVIPPISGLTGQLMARKEEKVAIIWPIAHPENIDIVKAILKPLCNLNLFVRLPRNIRESELNGLAFKRIPYDLDSHSFTEVCQEMSVAILPHSGYEIRGSSLASMFVGLGIPIIARSGNAFYLDLQPFSLVYPLDIRNIYQVVFEVMSISHRSNHDNAVLYRKYLRSAWQYFLMGEHESF